MQVPIPSDWTEEDGFCNYAICWPNSQMWLGILRGIITLPTRGRFWKGDTGIIVDAQAIGIQIRELNNPIGECFMTCNDVTILADAIRYFADVYASKACCENSGNGSGGSGSTSPTPSPQGDSPEDRTGPPPTGFNTWTEYNDYKCAVAHLLITQMGSDTLKGSLFTAFVGTATALAPLLIGLLATPIPGDELVVVAFAMIQLFVIATSFSLIYTWLEDNRDDLVCAILSGTDVASCISAFVSEMETLVDASTTEFPTEIFRYSVKQWLSSLATVASFNRLYEKLPYNVGTATCDCFGTLPRQWTYPGTDYQEWVYEEIADPSACSESHPTGQLRISMVNSGVGTSKIARFVYYPEPGEIVIPPSSQMVVAAFGNGLCANGLLFGVKFADETINESNISPYTWQGPGFQNETLNFTHTGEVEEVYVRFDQGTNCTTAGTSFLGIGTVTLQVIP